MDQFAELAGWPMVLSACSRKRLTTDAFNALSPVELSMVVKPIVCQFLPLSPTVYTNGPGQISELPKTGTSTFCTLNSLASIRALGPKAETRMASGFKPLTLIATGDKSVA